MLSRTADHLYWMARYIERAENTARMLDVTYRTSLLPYQCASRACMGRAVVGAARHHRHARRRTTSAIRTLTRRRTCCTSWCSTRRTRRRSTRASSGARESARAVRGAITSEMWEDLNSAWLEMRAVDYERIESQRRVGVLRLGQVALAPVPRRDVRHDAARRGVPLHPPRHAHGARRQHRAHPRREIPHPAAVGRRTSAARSTTTSGRRCCTRCPASSRTARSTAT